MSNRLRIVQPKQKSLAEMGAAEFCDLVERSGKPFLYDEVGYLFSLELELAKIQSELAGSITTLNELKKKRDELEDKLSKFGITGLGNCDVISAAMP